MKYNKGDIVKLYLKIVNREIYGIIVRPVKDSEYYLFIENHSSDRYFDGGELLIDDSMVVKHYGNDVPLLEEILEWRKNYLDNLSTRFDKYILTDFIKERDAFMQKKELNG